MQTPHDVEIACTCGKAIPVYFREAGGNTVCTCGTVVEVPRLSELRLLLKEAPPIQQLEELTRQQVAGRKILGTMFAFVVFGMIFQLIYYPTEMQLMVPVMRVIGILSIGVFCCLAWFTVLGRIWARLIIVVQLLYAIVVMVMAYHVVPHPGVIALTSIYILMVLLLMTIKT